MHLWRARWFFFAESRIRNALQKPSGPVLLSVSSKTPTDTITTTTKTTLLLWSQPIRVRLARPRCCCQPRQCLETSEQPRGLLRTTGIEAARVVDGWTTACEFRDGLHALDRTRATARYLGARPAHSWGNELLISMESFPVPELAKVQRNRRCERCRELHLRDVAEAIVAVSPNRRPPGVCIRLGRQRFRSLHVV